MPTPPNRPATEVDAHFAHPMTLAHEGVDGSIGLGNALMFAARNASFDWAAWANASAWARRTMPCEMTGTAKTVAPRSART